MTAENSFEVAIKNAEPMFMASASEQQANLVFAKECSFALQILKENDFLAKIARGNMASLQSAIVNIANIGLSLNTAQKHAYLIPRGGKVCLDVSYIGLLHLAAREKRIKNASADVVREGDLFLYNGKTKEPQHSFDPFDSERHNKKIVGAYCIAVLPDESVMVEVMSKVEIDKAMNAGSSKDKDVWKKWPEEMCKKTVVKRASKYWIYGASEKSSLARAIEYLNVENGEGVARIGRAQQSNAELLSNVLHENKPVQPIMAIGKPKEKPSGIIIEAKATMQTQEKDADPDLSPVDYSSQANEEPKKEITATTQIMNLVDTHNLHDVLDVLLQAEGIADMQDIETLSREKKHAIFKNLRDVVKKKINTEQEKENTNG